MRFTLTTSSILSLALTQHVLANGHSDSPLQRKLAKRGDEYSYGASSSESNVYSSSSSEYSSSSENGGYSVVVESPWSTVSSGGDSTVALGSASTATPSSTESIYSTSSVVLSSYAPAPTMTDASASVSISTPSESASVWSATTTTSASVWMATPSASTISLLPSTTDSSTESVSTASAPLSTSESAVTSSTQSLDSSVPTTIAALSTALSTTSESSIPAPTSTMTLGNGGGMVTSYLSQLTAPSSIASESTDAIAPTSVASTSTSSVYSVESSSSISYSVSASNTVYSASSTTSLYDSVPSAAPYSSSSSSSGSSSSSNMNAAGELVAGYGQVIVAPKEGELRMVPFAIEIPAGGELTFIWGAGPHTVTQSSSLSSVCEKSTEAGAFASGPQNAGFQYPIVVAQDTSPTYYFCGVKTHCEMGMFGIINPKVVTDASQSFGSWMDTYAATDNEFAKMRQSTEKDCADNEWARNWGHMYDYNQVAPWARKYAAESIMATRSYHARNARIYAAEVSNSTSTSLMPIVPSPTTVAPKSSYGSTSGAERLIPAFGMLMLALVLVV